MWLAKLIADRYVVGPMLKFLKNIKMRSRDVRVKKKDKWEQRRDQKKEDQLEGQ